MPHLPFRQLGGKLPQRYVLAKLEKSFITARFLCTSRLQSLMLTWVSDPRERLLVDNAQGRCLSLNMRVHHSKHY